MTDNPKHTPGPLTLEQLRNDLCERIRSIDTDERYHYPNATITVNAPLALIQLNMETIVYECQRVLGLMGYEGPEMKVKKGPRRAAISRAEGGQK
jgi:hypothetical protein